MSVKHVILALFLLWSSLLAADCATTAGIARPERVPDVKLCRPGQADHCYGWEPIEFEVDTTLSGKSRLFQWISGNTTCFVLIRGETLNGTLCFDRNNCNICAYDGRKTFYSELEEGPKVNDNCANCHGSGPMLPTAGIWLAARDHTKKINETCTSLGGPVWVNAPPSWPQRGKYPVVKSPKTCASCHNNFIAAPGFCGVITYALENENGSMKKYAFDTNSPEEAAECKQFAKDMNCSLNCNPGSSKFVPFKSFLQEAKTHGYYQTSHNSQGRYH